MANKQTKKRKVKTNKAAAKRFKKTKSGRFKRAQAGRRHLLSSKSSKRMRRLRNTTYVDKSYEQKLRTMLPYA